MAEGFSYPVGSLEDFKELERNETSFESLSQLLESEFKKDFLVACKTGTEASYALIYSIDQESQSQEFVEWYKQNYEIDENFTEATSQALTSIGRDAGLSASEHCKKIDLVVGGSYGYQAYRATEENHPEPENLVKAYFKHIEADQQMPLSRVESYILKDLDSKR